MEAKKIFALFVFVFFCALNPLPCTLSYAAVPHLINYQGRLTDTSGAPLTGSYAITFRIYDAETAGNLLWEENQTGVLVQKGIFNILLGSVANLNLTFDKPYFLEIKVGGEVMTPRQRMTSAGYAIMAEEAKIRADSADPSVGYLIDKVDNSSIKVDPATHKMYAALTHGSHFFTSSGTWTCPAGITTVFVTMVGGGGGGGGSMNNYGMGGGAGAASVLRARYTVVAGNNYTVTVGAKGTGGTGAVGSAGTNSVFDTLSVNGGAGSNNYIGGVGGATLNNTVNVGGNSTTTTGGTGGVIAYDAYAGGNGGSATYLTGGGGGGSSLFGAGGAGGNAYSNGINATGFGAGGGGSGRINSGNLTGGDGTPGFVLVEW